MDLGYKVVPCAIVDVDKVREKALNIALNKIIPGIFLRRSGNVPESVCRVWHGRKSDSADMSPHSVG